LEDLHPNGNNSLDEAVATGTGVKGGGGEIVLAKALLTFQEFIGRSDWVSPADRGNGESTAFNYAAAEAGGYSHLNGVISHEVTHVGAGVHGMPPQVLGLSGSFPAWVKAESSFQLFGVPFSLYHRGNVFEYEAYLKPVSYSDAQYGLAVNVYFRALGATTCTLNPNPIMPVDAYQEANRQAIWNYIRSDKELRRVFKPDNKTNKGGWTYPDLSH